LFCRELSSHRLSLKAEVDALEEKVVAANVELEAKLEESK